MKNDITFWASLIIASVYNSSEDTFLSIVWLIFAIVIFIISLIKEKGI